MVRKVITDFVIPSGNEESPSRPLYDQFCVGFLVASRLEMTDRRKDKNLENLISSVLRHKEAKEK